MTPEGAAAYPLRVVRKLICESDGTVVYRCPGAAI